MLVRHIHEWFKMEVLFLVLILSNVHAEALKYELNEICPGGGDITIYPMSLNDNGQITGYKTIQSDQTFVYQYFIWDKINGFKFISPSYRPWKINNKGQYLSYNGEFYDSDNTLIYADQNHYATWGADLTDSGQILGGYKHEKEDPFRGFVWDSLHGFEDIGDLGYGLTYARAINDSGVVVGMSSATDWRREAFIWSRDAGMKSLGSLSLFTEGPVTSSAYDINNFNLVVGETNYDYSAGYHAFIWSEESGMVDLGSLTDYSTAIAINDDGWVIGRCWGDPTHQEIPFLWSQEQGMIDINSFLSEDYLDYQIRSIFSLNNSNQIIAGVEHDGQYRYYLMTPVPEPATLSLLGMGAVIMGRMGKRGG